MASHSSTLAWKIPWTEEPGGLQSMGSLRVGHDWSDSLSLFTLCTGEGNGNPLQYSCLENPRDGGAWWAAFYGVAQSRTRLKRLSSSSSSSSSELRSHNAWQATHHFFLKKIWILYSSTLSTNHICTYAYITNATKNIFIDSLSLKKHQWESLIFFHIIIFLHGGIKSILIVCYQGSPWT